MNIPQLKRDKANQYIAQVILKFQVNQFLPLKQTIQNLSRSQCLVQFKLNLQAQTVLFKLKPKMINLMRSNIKIKIVLILKHQVLFQLQINLMIADRLAKIKTSPLLSIILKIILTAINISTIILKMNSQLDSFNHMKSLRQVV